MNAATSGVDAPLTKALRAAAVAFLATLDEAGGMRPIADGEGTPIEYDPLNDEPPFSPNPQKSASEAQQKLAWITFLGAIARIYAQEGRGAITKEVSALARKAGYSGGNAVNGWNSRPGSPRAVELNESSERFLNDESWVWVQGLASELGISLVGEYRAVPGQAQ